MNSLYLSAAGGIRPMVIKPPVAETEKPEAEGVTGIVTPPNPEQDRIAKEKKQDLSLNGILKKHEVHKEGMSK